MVASRHQPSHSEAQTKEIRCGDGRFNAALQIDPKYASALNNPVESSQNKFAETMKDCDAVISLTPYLAKTGPLFKGGRDLLFP